MWSSCWRQSRPFSGNAARYERRCGRLAFEIAVPRQDFRDDLVKAAAVAATAKRRPPVRLHEILSRHLLVPAAGLRRNFSAFGRNRYLHFKTGMQFRQLSVSWTIERRREWMLARLRALVRYAYQSTPYYHELFRSIGFDPEANFTFDDYCLIPPLTREQILESGEKLLSTQASKRDLQRDATGGTTGTPTTVFLGPEESGWRESGMEFMFQRLGIAPGMPTAFLWGHNLDPGARDSWRDRWYAYQQNFTWIDAFRFSPETLHAAHLALSRCRPAVMVCYASAVTQFAEFLRERNIHPDYPSHCIITGAEKLFPSARNLVMETFGVAVHERYGGRDVGALGIQLEPQTHFDFELDWPAALVEPQTRDLTNAPVLVTKLWTDGMPMLRYRNGDVGHFPADARPGNPSFQLREVFGREVDRIWLKNGSWVNGTEIPHILKDYPVREFALIQHEDYTVELQLVPRVEFDANTQSQLQHILVQNVPGVPVAIRLVAEIAKSKANKWRPVVTHVKRPPQGAG